MSPLVGRHGVKDVENSLGGGEKREEKRIRGEKFVTKNNKVPSMAGSKLTTGRKEGLFHIRQTWEAGALSL